MAMAATSLDPDAVQQLLSIGQQYVKVEKEMHKLVEELKSSRKRRRQLAAEVRFLHEKRRSFQRISELDTPSQVAYQLKSMEAPQFYEVEVKFASSLQSGMMDSMVFEYPPSPRDSQHEFAPDILSRQDKFSAQSTASHL
ncbi:unnamed protein product [Calypogeia fissa]